MGQMCDEASASAGASLLGWSSSLEEGNALGYYSPTQQKADGVNMTRACAIGLVVFLTLSSEVAAESAGSALRSFGLIGTWSVDCSVDLKQVCTRMPNCGSRFKFEAPLFGNPTEEVITQARNSGGETHTVHQLINVSRLGEDKIKFSYTIPPNVNMPGRLAYLMPLGGEVWETVLKKEPDKMRTWLIQREDGQKVAVRNGHPAIPGGDWNWNSNDPKPVTTWNESGAEAPWFQRCAN
jgi:hypothetical protein